VTPHTSNMAAEASGRFNVASEVEIAELLENRYNKNREDVV